MYISDVNRKTEEQLAKFCERNDLSYEVWINPKEDETSDFFIPLSERIEVRCNLKHCFICVRTVTEYEDSYIIQDVCIIDSKDYYQVVW